MDWIEQWFGFAPDNGDGSVELLTMIFVATVIAVAVVWKVRPARAAALRFVAQLQTRIVGRPKS